MPSDKKVSGLGSSASSQALQVSEDENVKSCWVCFATEADDRLAAWVQPCKCIGTTKWVCDIVLLKNEVFKSDI